MSDVMTGRLTLEEFFALPDDDLRPRELVDGEVREMSPVHGPAGQVGANMVWLLTNHVRARGLGWVWGDNMGFALLGARQTSRSPDAAFVRLERLPLVPRGPIRVAPDLAVEVLSPTETASVLEDKLADYRAAGTPLIWVVDPDARSVAVHPADGPSYTLGEGDTLTGGRVLPEFRCSVAELFEGVPRAS